MVQQRVRTEVSFLRSSMLRTRHTSSSCWAHEQEALGWIYKLLTLWSFLTVIGILTRFVCLLVLVFNFGSSYVSGKLPTYPSPTPKFCPKWEVSVNVGWKFCAWTLKYKIWSGGRTTRYKVYPNQLNRLKRVEKLHHLKTQPIFSEAFPNEMARTLWFSNRNFRFSHVNGKHPRCPFNLWEVSLL